MKSNAVARKALEAMMDLQHFRKVSVWFKEGREEGRAEGREEAARRLLARLLAKRGIVLEPEQQARIAACGDVDELERWCEQVVDAQTAEGALRLVSSKCDAARDERDLETTPRARGAARPRPDLRQFDRAIPGPPPAITLSDRLPAESHLLPRSTIMSTLAPPRMSRARAASALRRTGSVRSPRWGRRIVVVLLAAPACVSATGVRALDPPASPSPSAIAPISPLASDLARIAPRPVVPGSSPCSSLDLADVIDHVVELSVALAPPSLSANGVVRVRARRPTPELCLDARGLQITSARVEGSPTTFRRDGDAVLVSLPVPLVAGEERSLWLTWTVPVDRETPHADPAEMWAGYATSAWMPTLQDPAQRATLTLRLVAPSSTRAAASGQLVDVGTTTDGRVVHTFRLDRPSAPFLYAFAVGRFDERSREVDGVRLRALGPPGVDLDAALALTEPMLRFLHERLGAAYAAPVYTQVFVRGEAAQEAAAMALVSSSAIDDVRRDPTDDWVFLHELSHQWFAWLVSCADFGDLWLNEGFASFMVAAYKEQRWGRRAYEREVELWRKRSAKVHDERRDAPVSLAAPGAARRAVRDADLPPRGVTYARGALVLHRLRDEVGDAAFWSALRRYVADRAGRGATSEDLRTSLEAASGRDLTAFFARWVYASAPDL